MKMRQILMNKENKDVEIGRIIKDDIHTVVHYKTGDEIVMSVFKDDQEIDSIRTKDFGVNPLNGRTQIDGQQEPNVNANTNKTKDLVMEFHKEILLVGAYETIDKMSNYISETKYLQHNVDNGIGDGLDQLKSSIRKMISYGSDLKYDELVFSVAQGDMVFIKNIQNWLNPETNQIEKWQYFDIFRVEENKIVEHWDILGPLK